MGAGGVKEDAPASVGREAKGLLRRQGSKSPSCLIGSIIAFNGTPIYHSVKLNYIQDSSTSDECEKGEVSRFFYAFGCLYAQIISYKWTR